MDENSKDNAVYEIGYLIIRSVPEEKVGEEADIIRNVITKAGASVIGEEPPHKEDLAYTMRKKTVSGAYDKFDQAYFGWIKFEMPSGNMDELKKSVEKLPNILRFLFTRTVRENTFMGKRASAIAASFGEKEPERKKEKEKEKEVDAVVSIEEMDKSIDEMVKEAI